MVNILSGSQIGRKLRKKIAGVIKLLPEMIRYHAMLADPVNF